MERRFDMSDFERSLKDHADQFKMIPSKRVWNGIYNNLHPGSKWPSITVAIIFLFTLFTIGKLNTSTDHINNPNNSDFNNGKNVLKGQDEFQPGKLLSEKKVDQNNSSNIDEKVQDIAIVKKENNSTSKITQDKNLSVLLSTSPSSFVSKNAQAGNKAHQKLKVVSLNIRTNNEVDNKLEKNADLSSPITYSSEFIEPNSSIDLSFQQNETIKAILERERQGEMNTNDILVPVSFLNSPHLSQSVNFNWLSFNDQISDADRNSENEGNSLNGDKKRKKKNNKIEWTFYLNPVISTVSFSKKRIQPTVNNSSVVILSSQAPFKLMRSPRIGMEAGTEMSFKIDKKFKLITGFNLNYSGYNNLSNLVHPTYGSLTLTDKNGRTYSKNYITHYGNGQSSGHVSLLNYNVQASIPLGIQFNIWGNEKIKIDLASLLEPSILLKNDAFLISADGRYYVNDPLLVRRTNLDGHLGSYITIIGKKIKWHIGPDFRYQLFSAYKSIYPTKEHLIDYGIRIGISKQN